MKLRTVFALVVVAALLLSVVELACLAGEKTASESASGPVAGSVEPDLPIASEVEDAPVSASPVLTR